jgi:hypothetical protein
MAATDEEAAAVFQALGIPPIRRSDAVALSCRIASAMTLSCLLCGSWRPAFSDSSTSSGRSAIGVGDMTAAGLPVFVMSFRKASPGQQPLNFARFNLNPAVEIIRASQALELASEIAVFINCGAVGRSSFASRAYASTAGFRFNRRGSRRQ